MTEHDYENAIRACYSTWGETYYDEYYGDKAPYPPVHRDILKRLLKEAEIKSLLDAGCGPASFLRDLTNTGIDLYGFDLTPEMVAVAKRIMQEKGYSPDHFWEGSVSVPEHYRRPDQPAQPYDAAICVGVFPHIPADIDAAVIRNLHEAVRPDGLVVIEARNQLFALFTGNRYSYQFIVDELIRPDDLRPHANTNAHDSAALDTALEDFKQLFRMDLPPVRKGKADEPGYDEVLSRTHNPLVLREQFAAAGFKDVQVLFYHYHALPPMLGGRMPELFRQQSVAMENPTDWRGYFMASAFLLVGRRA